MMKRLALAILAVLSAAPSARAGVETDRDDALLCLKETVRQEKRGRIQTNLLSAIALVESGRFSKKYPSGVSWPWTVTAEGKGTFHPSKDDALSAVRALQAKGVDNIDVGCMQINLKYHPDAFDSLEDALDPAKNVAYAAEFLKRNYGETKSWGEAATRYHSKTVRKAFRYEDKLLDAWNRLSEHGNPADPDKKAAVRDVSAKTVADLNKKTEKVQKKKRKTAVAAIKAGSPESRELAAEWRKMKLEEYMARKKAKESAVPIFEDAPSKTAL